jgi:hypothetical protein
MFDIQRSFATGEVAPSLYARQDVGRIGAALRVCRNFIVRKEGGARYRTGTRYIAETKDSGVVKLIKFVFNDEQTYILEFGAGYIRFYQGGARLDAYTSPPANWSNVTNYAAMDKVLYLGNAYYAIAAGTNHQPDVSPTYWYPLTGDILEIPTDYTADELFEIKYEQSADVMTLVHPNHPVTQLQRYGDRSWLLVQQSFIPGVSAPNDGVASTSAAGAIHYRYRITALDSTTAEESFYGTEAATLITGATQANPCVITSVAHPYATGDQLSFSGIGGMTQLNGTTAVITKTGANTYSLDGVDSTAYGAYTAGGQAVRDFVAVDGAAVTTNTLTWSVVAGAGEYNIYKEYAGVFGLVGSAKALPGATIVTYADSSASVPLASRNPPSPRNPFIGAGNYPSTVAYYQQRLCFGHSDLDPETVWMSQVGNYDNFTNEANTADSAAVTFTLAGRLVSAVEHMVDVGGRFVILTSTSEWTANGGDGGAITPTAINARTNGSTGSGPIRPVIVDSVMLFQQRRGSLVRDINYDFGSDSLKSRDLTVFSSHLFAGYTLVSMDFQQLTDNVLWCVRSDGALLGLTYLAEQDVWGWHRHDTDGEFEDVCTIPEGSYDASYFVVGRTINGTSKRYIERLANPFIQTPIEAAWFVDCGGEYNGTNTGSDTMTVTANSGWTVDDTQTLVTSGFNFVAGDVGNAWVLRVGDDEVTFTATVYINSSTLTVTPSKDVPVAFQGVVTADWSKAVDVLSGLSYLEGKTLSVLADGEVQPQVTVSGGSVTLAKPFSQIIIGLPYQGDLETLDMEPAQGQTIIDKKKQLLGVHLLVESSRGIKAAGATGPFRELKQRTTEPYGSPPDLRTGTVEILTSGEWNDNGRVRVQQTDPLPLTVLAIAPQYRIGG